MVTISGKRNKGKTTILLHYMVCNPYAVMVVGKDADIPSKLRMVDELGLKIKEDRFVSVARVNDIHNRMTLVVDDLDIIMRTWPWLIGDFIAKVTVATVNSEMDTEIVE